MSHTCHATECNIPVAPTLWGCRRHWYMVPKPIRDRIWATYRPGQCDDKNPSEAYCEAARDAVIAVAKKEGVVPDTRLYDFFLSRRVGPSSLEYPPPPNWPHKSRATQDKGETDG